MCRAKASAAGFLSYTFHFSDGSWRVGVVGPRQSPAGELRAGGRGFMRFIGVSVKMGQNKTNIVVG